MFSRFTTAIALLAAVGFLVDDALALKVPVRKHRHRKGAAAQNNTLSARQANPDPLDLDNVFDLYYSSFITIAGQELEVQLDTGSSELWVRPKQPFPVSQVIASNASLTIRYGIGNFDGTMTRANVTLGDENVPGQYFLNYTQGQINNVFQAGLDGMLGLGFDDGSSLRKLVNRTTNVDNGHTLLTNFFTANPGLPRTMSFFMGRNNDPLSDDDDGVFMLGQPEPEFAAVATGPVFPVHLNTGVGDFQRWSLYVDAFEVNGANVTGVRSVVPGVSDGSLVANIDTGTSLAWVPRAIADAIYKNIPGVQYSEATSLYTVPCMQTVRLAIWIDGHRYPIHPMDITRVQSRAGTSGKTEYFCTNTFMYSSALAQQSRELDMQLGDSFLRNVLAQYDFGNPADHSTANIRLVSTTTDELAALNAFNQQRSQALGIPPALTELPGLPSGATASSTQIGTTTPANRPPDSTSAVPPGSSPSAPGGGDAGSGSDPSSQDPDDGSSIHLPSAVTLGIGLLSSLLVF